MIPLFPSRSTDLSRTQSLTEMFLDVCFETLAADRESFFDAIANFGRSRPGFGVSESWLRFSNRPFRHFVFIISWTGKASSSNNSDQLRFVSIASDLVDNNKMYIYADQSMR